MMDRTFLRDHIRASVILAVLVGAVCGWVWYMEHPVRPGAVLTQVWNDAFEVPFAQ